MKIKGKEDVKKQILLLLAQNKEPVTVANLAEKISMSGKSVRNYLKILKEELKDNDMSLVIKPNLGVYLDVSDEEKTLLRNDIMLKDVSEEEFSPQYRQSYILRTLLKSKYTYTLQLLAEDLYCSKSTIVNDLTYTQNWLEERGLHLRRKQNQGLWIEGNENEYRRAMMDLFSESKINKNVTLENESDKLDYRVDVINYKKIRLMFPRIDLYKIQEIIVQAEEKLQYYFTDQAFINLIIHIAIAIERVKNEKEIKMVDEFFKSLTGKYELQVAAWVVEKLSETFHLTFSQDEIGYIALHMLGAKIQEDLDPNNCDVLLDTQNEEYVNTAKEIVGLAGDVLEVDLSKDKLLLTALVLHLRPTTVRLKYGLKLRNPILDTIKNEYTSIFGAAWACSSIFEKKLGISINEDEVGYIAMHLAVGVSRLSKRIKAIVVCSSGVGTSQLISIKLEKRFHEIDIIAVIPLYSLKKEIISKADIIISTIPGVLNSPKFVYVSAMLGVADVLKIQNTLERLETRSSREVYDERNLESSITGTGVLDEELCFVDDQRHNLTDIINHYGKIMEEKGYVKNGFCENVMERENKSSTVIGKGIAIPHSTQEFVEKSKICIVRLKDAIILDDEKVKLVIILALKFIDYNITKEFYRKFYSILDNEKLIDKIMESNDKSQVLDIFLNGGIKNE
jgi:transcriptional antiterminator/mannitol/fructose-specific phosphotransferase system IIA component (Ntr-type)